jgi:hypothetical protein
MFKPFSNMELNRLIKQLIVQTSTTSHALQDTGSVITKINLGGGGYGGGHGGHGGGQGGHGSSYGKICHKAKYIVQR